VHSVSVNLEPGQYLAGWRPEAGSLFVPAVSGARVGDHVAVRVGIYGQTIRATVHGKVAAVRRVGRPALPPGVEISLDRASLPAAGFLAMAARGEPVSFHERPPRIAAEIPLDAVHGRARVGTTTLNVSDGGCALRWPGPLPQVGQVVGLRLGRGLLSPVVSGVVCWSEPGGAVERSVGLRIVSQGRAGRAWRARVVGAGRASGRPA
jgi:hypothetical protein